MYVSLHVCIYVCVYIGMYVISINEVSKTLLSLLRTTFHADERYTDRSCLLCAGSLLLLIAFLFTSVRIHSEYDVKEAYTV